jgi:hypothetical protein
MALSLYELHECPPGMQNEYMTHQRGALMLRQLRGPEACTLPLGHSLFLALRTQAVSLSPSCLTFGICLATVKMLLLGTSAFNRDTFLTRPEWIERPWKLFPKTPTDELFDLLFEYQAILQQSNEVSREKNQTVLQEGFRDVLAKSLKVETAMRGVYEKFENSVSGLLYWPELSTLQSQHDNTKLGKVFPISFYFPVFFVAQVVTTCWTSMMAVHFLLMYAYNKFASLDPSTALSSTTDNQASTRSGFLSRSREHRQKWETMAKNVCQSVEYFLQDKMGLLGL